MGGFGISRYQLDFVLSEKAKEKGVLILQDTVVNTNFKNGFFTVKTKENKTFQSKIAIGAFGKRSLLDVKMGRNFIQKKAPYLGVKIHVKGTFSNNFVALHNFKGGYCGVSKVEKNTINLCYITTFSSFKKYKNIEEFQEKVDERKLGDSIKLYRIEKSDEMPIDDGTVDIIVACFVLHHVESENQLPVLKAFAKLLK